MQYTENYLLNLRDDNVENYLNKTHFTNLMPFPFNQTNKAGQDRIEYSLSQITSKLTNYLLVSTSKHFMVIILLIQWNILLLHCLFSLDASKLYTCSLTRIPLLSIRGTGVVSKMLASQGNTYFRDVIRKPQTLHLVKKLTLSVLQRVCFICVSAF